MSGVPGKGGPPPKRSDQRRRQNQPAGGKPTKAPGAIRVKPPAVKGSWHPTAKRFFRSLRESGQSVFYEPSDWEAAYLLAESISRELSPQAVVAGAEVVWVERPPTGAALTAWGRMMTSLMVTEGDRRRSQLELQRPEASEEASDVFWIDDARRRLRESG